MTPIEQLECVLQQLSDARDLLARKKKQLHDVEVLIHRLMNEAERLREEIRDDT